MRDHQYETSSVRPYTVTGGRVRSSHSDLPLETLVEAMGNPATKIQLFL